MTTEQKLAYWPASTGLGVRETTLGDLLRDAADRVPDRIALVDGGPPSGEVRRWTYGQLLKESERLAGFLLSEFAPGEHIAVWSPNCPEWAVLQYGAALAGLVLVTVNPTLRQGELLHVLGQSQAVGLLYAGEQRGASVEGLLDRLRPELPHLRSTHAFAEWADLLAAAPAEAALPKIYPMDPIQIQYTSGTTGFAKGCLLHHLGTINAARSAAVLGGLREGAVWVNPMPMFHVGSCVMSSVGVATALGTHVIMPSFDPRSLLEVIESEHANLALSRRLLVGSFWGWRARGMG